MAWNSSPYWTVPGDVILPVGSPVGGGGVGVVGVVGVVPVHCESDGDETKGPEDCIVNVVSAMYVPDFSWCAINL